MSFKEKFMHNGQHTKDKDHKSSGELKVAKFKMLLFCQKLFSWYQISSCKYTIYLHCVYKVSGPEVIKLFRAQLS